MYTVIYISTLLQLPNANMGYRDWIIYMHIHIGKIHFCMKYKISQSDIVALAGDTAHLKSC